MDQTELKPIMDKVERTYSGKGPFRKDAWKRISDGKCGPEVIEEIYELLKGSLLYWPESKGSCLIVSPTANRATHERQLFALESARHQGPLTFLAGDWHRFPNQSQVIETDGGSHIFQTYQGDAHHLPVADNSVDVIWDRKGWLWHVSDKKNPQLIVEVLEQYQSKLKEGGVLVFDAIVDMEAIDEEIWRAVAVLTLMPLNLVVLILAKITHLPVPARLLLLYRHFYDQFEESTWELMTQADPHHEIDSYIKEHFIADKLGTRKSRVMALRKRSSKQQE